MLQIENTEYAIGTIWDFLNESETETIKSFYDVLIQYKNNKDLVTYLYSSMNPHPKYIDSGYYDEETFKEIKQFVDNSNDIRYQPHQQNKMLHQRCYELAERIGLGSTYFNKVFYPIMDKVCAGIINKHYELNISANDIKSVAQLTWYTDGDFITMHDDGYVNDRLCAVLIYLTPPEHYNMNGGELVLKNRQNHIDIVYPVLGNYGILDFTKSMPVHSVHKVMNDFNRFAYLNFVVLKNK